MRLRWLVAAWNNFFFAPRSPLPVALFRILYGTMVTATLVLLHRDWLAWYGAHPWVSMATVQQLEPGTRLNVFTIIPQNNHYIETLFWVFLAAAMCLTIGLLTRLSAATVFLCLTSIQQRNLYITHGGDTFLRVAGFFLIFAPAGAAMSVDRFIRLRKGKEGPQIQPRSPWAQRMIQFELALMYFMSFWWKSLGHPWVNGTALYYVIHFDEIRRFPIPDWIAQPAIVKLGSWFTLALEFALGTLVWIKEFRYPLLLLGLLFHLCLEYLFNIPLFQWDILAGYVLFIDPADIARAGNWARNLLRLPSGEALIHKLVSQTAHGHNVPWPRRLLLKLLP
jgi:Vitamin K-dependent gamma-carboxylase